MKNNVITVQGDHWGDTDLFEINVCLNGWQTVCQTIPVKHIDEVIEKLVAFKNSLEATT